MQAPRRILGSSAIVLVVTLVLAAALPGFADQRDISVGGVYICTISHDAAGYTSFQRAVQVNQRITQVLSTPGLRKGGTITVQPAGAAATVSVSNILVFTVMPEDTEGQLSTVALAKSWAQLLAKGLQVALPGSGFYF